jgi:predicted TIM-barrel fold metal-dependent hydrolase
MFNVTEAQNQRRKPDFKLPPLSCDTHCHVFGPQSRFPYALERTYTPADAPKETLRAMHDHLGIGRAAIVQASCHGTDNSAMLNCIASDPKRYRGVAMVDDNFGDADYDKLDRGGIRGVRFNFVKHLGGVPEVGLFNRIIDRVKGRGWHVVLHLDAKDIPSFADMIAALPLPFVIDHMGRAPAKDGIGQPAVQALLELARRDNCWIKVCGADRISMPPYSEAIPIAHALVEAAPDRVVWGTDFPHPNSSHEVDEAALTDLIPTFAAASAARQKLLVDNPARLYGFN